MLYANFYDEEEFILPVSILCIVEKEFFEKLLINSQIFSGDTQ